MNEKKLEAIMMEFDEGAWGELGLLQKNAKTRFKATHKEGCKNKHFPLKMEYYTANGC